MNTKELGDLGEKLACEYLVERECKILVKNYRITFGEIDIIAAQKGTLHFVEVKTIAGAEGIFPEEHVDYRKQRKLRNMAEIWISKNATYQESPYQIDIIGITVDEQSRNARLHYFPNAVEG